MKVPTLIIPFMGGSDVSIIFGIYNNCFFLDNYIISFICPLGYYDVFLWNTRISHE